MNTYPNKHTCQRRAMAILMAVSASAILFILVGSLIYGVISTEQGRAVDTLGAQLTELESLALQNARVLIRENRVQNTTYTQASGATSIRQLRPVEPDDETVLYKDEHLSPRPGDMVLEIVSQIPFRSRSVYMDSTYIVNTTLEGQRTIRVLTNKGVKNESALPPANKQ